MGTVAGDLHDTGKNLVVMMLEATSFPVVVLGVDVPTDKFVQTVRGTARRLLASRPGCQPRCWGCESRSRL
jgi:methanogenic corrinoid protein MtbC1